MELKYFDVHSHISFKDYDEDRAAVVERMREAGVGTITVGVDIQTSIEAVSFAEKHEGFYATIGLHPNNTPTEGFDAKLYKKLLVSEKVVGVGECGLDYYRIESNVAKEKKRQLLEFEKQMAFAIEHNKPLMIHCRPTKGTMDAYLDLVDLLERKLSTPGVDMLGNVHFFVGDVGVARRLYAIGFTTSFTGVLTFTHDYDEVVRFVPLDMLLTETDSPYAAPAPFRGRRNESSYVKYVVEAIAKIRGEGEESVRAHILENARRVFRLG